MIRNKLTLLCLVLAAFSANVQAADVTWTSTTGGNFNDGLNWSSTPSPPASADTAIIQNGDTATINADFTNNPLTNLYVGNIGFNGTVNQTAGTLSLSGGLDVGRSDTTPGAVGVYNLSGGTLTVGSTTASYFLVGDGLTSGTGTMNISGTGLLNLPAGETFIGGMVVPSTTGAGTGGNGTLNMSGNSQLTQTTAAASFGFFYIGRDGATGTMTMTDNASFVKSNGNYPIVVGGGYGGAGGAGGKGTLTMSGSSTMTDVSGEIQIGQGTATTATVGSATLNDNASITTGNYFCVGRDSGTGTLTMNGNSKVTLNGTGFFVLGSIAGHGTVVLNGGTITNNLPMVLGEGTGGTGDFYLNGGLVQTSVLQAGTSTINNGTGNLYFNGGTLQATASTSNFTQSVGGTATLNTWVQSNGARIDTNGKNITFTAALWEDPLSTGGGLTKLGSGILNLTNTNTYTGNISVNGGTLLLNYPSLQGGLTTTVASGATLGGNCMLQNVVVSSGGGLAPGKNIAGTAPYPDIGTMQLSNLTITNANLNFYINRPGNSDLIDVTSGIVNVSTSGGLKNSFFFTPEVQSEMTAGDYSLIKCGTLTLPGGTTFADNFSLPNPYLGDFDASINVKPDLSIGPTGQLIYLTLVPSANGWKGPSGGLYSAAGNWKTIVPNGSGAKALFAGDGTPPSVLLDINPQVGKIVFNNPTSYTISTTNGSRFILNAGTGVPAEIDDLAGNHTIAVGLLMAKDTTFVVSGASDTLTVSGAITGANNNIIKDGPGTLLLSNNNGFGSTTGGTTVLGGTIQLDGTNSYVGATKVTGGTLIAKVIANAGVASSIGAAGTSPSNLALDNATFQYTGAAAVSTTRGIALADSVTIDTAQNLAFNGGLLLSTALDVTLNTPGAGTITFSGPITDGSAAPRFFKAGAGTIKFTAGAGVSSTLGQGLYDSCFVVQEGTAIIAGADNTTQYYVRNGEVTVGGTAVNQPATFTIQSGTLNIQTWLSIGRGNTNTSTMNMTSGVLNTANMSMGFDAGVVGYTGIQVLNLSGNAVVNSTATGTGNTNYVGESGGTNATLNISDTAQLNTGTYLIVGRFGNATGTVNQSGGTVAPATDLRIGQAGNGTYNQTGGTVTGQYLRLGLEATAVGVYNLTGGTGTFTTGIEADLGSAGTGTLNVGGTGSITLAPLFLGRSNFATVVDGGTGNLRVYGSGSVTVNGYVTGSSLGLPADPLIGKANIDLDGGTLTTNGIAKFDGGVGGGGVMTVNFNGGVLKAGASTIPVVPSGS